MLLPQAPEHMYRHRGQTVRNFGYDTATGVEYQFNSLGYRSPEIDTTESAVVLLGNTITFGLGVDYNKTFGGIIAQRLKCPVYNFAWGCYGHTNNEQVALLEQILTTITPRYVIFQINNLNRYRINGLINFDNSEDIIVDEYTKFYNAITKTLNIIPHGYLHWDNYTYPVDLPTCLVYNKYHVDHSIASNTNTFGYKSHRLIAERILQENI